MKDQLLELRKAVKAKLDAGEEPPWARENYQNLVMAIDVILKGLSATMILEDLPQPVLPDNVLPLKDYIARRDSLRSRPDLFVPQLPM